MPRAADDDVRDIIDTDPDKPIKALTSFINAASSLVDKVEANDSSSLLSAFDLKQIEIWLAAHFYACFDPQPKTTKAENAYATFQVGLDEKGALNTSVWGKQAMLLDVTGYLAELNQDMIRGKSKITFQWLGKPPSEQIDYVDRD